MTFPKRGSLLIFFLACLFLLDQPLVYGNVSRSVGVPAISKVRGDTLPITCAKTPEIEKIIGDAIALGAPIYNEGLHIACYRIYEWAGYKILYEYGKTCKEVEKILRAAIERSHGDYSDTEKAWLMRAAFDKILGVPTKTGATDKTDSRAG